MELNPITSSVFLIGMAGGIMADIILNTVIRIGAIEVEKEEKEGYLHLVESLLIIFLMALSFLSRNLCDNLGEEKIEPTFSIFSIFWIGTLVGMGLQIISEDMIRKKARKVVSKVFPKVFPFVKEALIVKENLAAENFVKFILFGFILLLSGICAGLSK